MRKFAVYVAILGTIDRYGGDSVVIGVYTSMYDADLACAKAQRKYNKDNFDNGPMYSCHPRVEKYFVRETQARA